MCVCVLPCPPLSISLKVTILIANSVALSAIERVNMLKLLLDLLACPKMLQRQHAPPCQRKAKLPVHSERRGHNYAKQNQSQITPKPRVQNTWCTERVRGVAQEYTIGYSLLLQIAVPHFPCNLPTISICHAISNVPMFLCT